MNQKKIRRLYHEEKLHVQRRIGRKPALGTRRLKLMPNKPNEHWSLDFASGAFTDGRRFRVLAIVDHFCRECLGQNADTSLSGLRVTRKLSPLIVKRGHPKTNLNDNGTELTSATFLKWCQDTGVGWHYIAPGKSMQNASWSHSIGGCATNIFRNRGVSVKSKQAWLRHRVMLLPAIGSS